MSRTPSSRRRRPRQQCFQPWPSVAVFVIVLVYVAYLMRTGQEATSAIVLTAGAALAASKIGYLLMHPPAQRRLARY